MDSNDMLGFLAVTATLTIRLDVVNKQGTTIGETDRIRAINCLFLMLLRNMQCFAQLFYSIRQASSITQRHSCSFK